MRAVERTHHINITFEGKGMNKIKQILKEKFPNIEFEQEEVINADDSVVLKQIKIERTPGKTLMAYRERAGLSLTDLAKKMGMQYTNLSAMERDNRVIGLKVAKRLAKELNCEYTKFIE